MLNFLRGIVVVKVLGIDSISAVVTKNAQKFTGVASQTDYTVTAFTVTSDDVVIVDDMFQPFSVVGSAIRLNFEPEGGEIIKVIKLNY